MRLHYDTAGNLKSQKDAKGQVISMEYDLLNRLIKRTESDDGMSTWVYDKSLNGIGKPSSIVNATTGFTRSYQYDTLGRGIAINTRIFATDYNVNTAYDANSRVSTVTYPATGIGNRFAVRNVYDAYGYLQRVEDAANADGKVINETLGNNLITVRAYGAEYGRLTGITTGVSGAVQSSQFVYDRIGNLTGRSWAVNGVTTGETFTYDDLNRLKTATIVGGATTTYNCDAIGNITAKSDFADNYIYGENGAGRDVAYTSFNMPRAIRDIHQSRKIRFLFRAFYVEISQSFSWLGRYVGVP